MHHDHPLPKHNAGHHIHVRRSPICSPLWQVMITSDDHTEHWNVKIVSSTVSNLEATITVDHDLLLYKARLFVAWLLLLHPRSNPHPLHPQLWGASSLLLLWSGIKSFSNKLRCSSLQLGAGAVNIIMLPTLLIPVTWFPDHKGLVSEFTPKIYLHPIFLWPPSGAWHCHLRVWPLLHSLLPSPDSSHQPQQPSSIEGIWQILSAPSSWLSQSGAFNVTVWWHTVQFEQQSSMTK